MAESSVLLRVSDLSVQFRTDAGIVRAVDGVSFDIRQGETLAVVGESGCGKSVTAMAVLRLIESQRGEVTGGKIEFDGVDLRSKSEVEMRAIRGNDIAMIFQEPMTSLNPVYSVGDQIGEVLDLHRGLSAESAAREVVRLLELVRIPDPVQRAREYPHQLSGGMRQRVMIAMALACRPKLLIADEPTTALDVTIQAQILDLLRDLQRRLGMSVLLITHDLGVVAELAQRVVVMYAGKVAERGDVLSIFERPKHPYTAGLFLSIPELEGTRDKLLPIAGSVPDALAFPSGCRFHPRCPYRLEPCPKQQPALVEHGSAGGEQLAACHYTEQHPQADLLRGKA
jgi:peptide/nickel transport system ATP-binding protein/oligopeptide transport system ATP-binding protein